MKLSRGRIDAFLRSPDPQIRVGLIFGVDQGLVRERARQLAETVVDDLSDPFRVSELTAQDIKNDPSRLADEAAAGSLVGGNRVVLIRIGGDDISKPLSLFLDNPEGTSLIVIQAGDLNPRSPVRKLCEAADNAAAIPCFGDDDRAVAELINSVLKENGCSVDADARQFLVANLGSDRMVSRRELEKLALYAGEKTSVSLADAIACVGDNGALSLDEVVYAMAGGDGSALDMHLERAYGSGLAPVAVLRAAQRHFQKLHIAADAVARGGSPEQAIKSVRPPVIYLFTDRFKRQLSIWNLGRIRNAIAMLLDAETECKSTAMPAQAVCGRALVRLCQAARKSVG